MKNNIPTFEPYVVRGILADNEFNIKDVNNLANIKSFNFEGDTYAVITDLIKSKAIDELKAMAVGNRTSEYLEVMSFQDQQNRNYIVTVYDSDEITQDPQVADIFFLGNALN